MYYSKEEKNPLLYKCKFECESPQEMINPDNNMECINANEYIIAGSDIKIV